MAKIIRADRGRSAEQFRIAGGSQASKTPFVLRENGATGQEDRTFTSTREVSSCQW
jgi:predicted PhzF superfamily epimerase YddE/YHI9